MKNIFTLLFLVLIYAGFDDESISDLYQQMEGTFKIDKMSALGVDLTDDLGTVTFNPCGENNCRGFFAIPGSNRDHFTYTLNADGTQLIIKDDTRSEKGSDFSGTYDITELTATALKISADTGLGNLYYEMSK